MYPVTPLIEIRWARLKQEAVIVVILLMVWNTGFAAFVSDPVGSSPLLLDSMSLPADFITVCECFGLFSPDRLLIRDLLV